MRFRSLYFIYIAYIIVFSFAGCSKSDDQRDFENHALNPPSGITETNSSGEIVGNTDQDDWRVGPMYRGLISIGYTESPAPYPNPLGYNQNLTLEIKFHVSDPVDAIEIRKFRTVGEQPVQIRYLQQDELTGFNTVTLPGKEIAYGEGSNASDTYRLMIYDGNYNLISYGDIKIE